MNILSICDNPDVLQVMRIINIVITVIKIAVPILLIIFIMIELIGAVADEEKFKKVTSGAVKKFIAALLIFLIPTFIQVIVVNVVGSNETNEEYKNCLKDLSVEQINKIYEKNSNTKIYLESIYPVNNSLNKEIVETRTNDNIKDLNNKIEKICNNNKCTYINMYDNLTDKNGNMKRIYTVDGLHLNKIGYKAVASKLTKYLNE